MQPHLIIGCDPGANGAIAVYNRLKKEWSHYHTDLDALVGTFSKKHPDSGLVSIAVEKQTPRPGQASTSFALGVNYGEMRAFLKTFFGVGAFVDFTEVSAVTWKKALGFKPLAHITDERKRYEANKQVVHEWVEVELGRKVPKYAADAYALVFWAMKQRTEAALQRLKR